MFCRLQAAIENYPGVYETGSSSCSRFSSWERTRRFQSLRQQNAGVLVQETDC
jgi:hypothetical protein